MGNTRPNPQTQFVLLGGASGKKRLTAWRKLPNTHCAGARATSAHSRVWFAPIYWQRTRFSPSPKREANEFKDHKKHFRGKDTNQSGRCNARARTKYRR